MKIKIYLEEKHLDTFLDNIDLFVKAIEGVHKFHSESVSIGNTEIGVCCNKYRKSYIVDVTGD